MSVTLSFKWAEPPLSLNDRPRHWAPHAEQIKAVRQLAAITCRNAIRRGELETGQPVEVTLLWYVPTRTRRDADNPVATLKPVCDGLVDAGLVPDDTPEWMHKRPVKIIYRKGLPGVELHIESKAEAAERAAQVFYGEMWPSGDWDREPESMRLRIIDAMRSTLWMTQ